MASAHSPAAAPIPGWKWSAREKALARKVFDLALSRELEGVIREAKEQAARITEASELWDLENWIGECRRRIDRTFDYRYSILPLVLARLLRDRQIRQDDLRGLAPDKIDAIRQMACS